jgi:hypothetical protein
LKHIAIIVIVAATLPATVPIYYKGKFWGKGFNQKFIRFQSVKYSIRYRSDFENKLITVKRKVDERYMILITTSKIGR